MGVYQDWDAFRQECHNYMRLKNENVIKSFLQTVDYYGTVGYYFNLADKILTIYTRHPGTLIGCNGKYAECLAEMLKKEYHDESWKVEFHEIKGGFVTIE